MVRFRVMANSRIVGDIDVELFDNDKPATVQNFLTYLLRGSYENTMLRVLFPNNAIQGGSFRIQNPRDSGPFFTYIQTPSVDAIINEYDVGPEISNTFGTIAMSLNPTNLDSATHTWFFNLADNSATQDTNKYVVFGRVIAGSNILSNFNALSYSNGIVNLASFPSYGLGGLPFTSLPVSYQGWREPRTKELYTTEISLLSSTDMTPPTISIVTPAANVRLTNGPIMVTGTATDNVGVHWVWISANDTLQTNAMGSNDWSATISPIAGKNTIFVESVDTSGNRSMPAVRTFYYHPFVAQKGTYNGLFYETNEVQQESSGTFTATLQESGAFTAALMVAGKRYSLRGQFVLEDQGGTIYGRASIVVPRAGTTTLLVELAVNLSQPDDLITGLVGAPASGWESPLSADRAVYSAGNCPYEGKYTIILPGTPGDPMLPAGSGFGTVSIGPTGKLKLAGTLADGTKISQSAMVSGFGEWPVYVPLYKKQGLLVRWISFLESEEEDLFGSLTWIKPTDLKAKNYQAGLTNDLEATGSRYQRPTNTTDYVVSFTNGMVIFSDGNLAADFSNNVMLTPGNKIVDVSTTNKLKMTVTTSTGLFKGSVIVPGATRATAFQGAIHRKGDYGAGFLLGTNQSSGVLFGP